MRSADRAMTPAIPGHLFQDDSHGADVSESGESQTHPDKSAKKDPQRVDSESEEDASQHQQACAKPDLTLERPASHHAGHDWMASFDPGFRAAFENRDLPVTRLEQAGGHAGAPAGLANEDEGKIAVEIVEAGLDLIHRDIDGSGDVPAGEF